MIFRSRLIASVLMLAGAGFLLVVLLPIGLSILRFQFFSPVVLIDPTAASRYPRPRVINVLGLASPDYSRPQTWFPTAPSGPAPPSSSAVRYYTLSIPSIGLDAVPVEISGPDLQKNAVQYPGTALPGQVGNTVILGHSALPGLYPKNSPFVVFNSLPKVKIGSQVTIKYDGITYRYLVKDTREVTPDRVDVLAPSPDRRQLTLITCVPLGTYWHRFVATAYLLN